MAGGAGVVRCVIMSMTYGHNQSELKVSKWLHANGCAWENGLTKVLTHEILLVGG